MDKPEIKVSIIGAGHIGLALAKGFLKVKAFKTSQIILANPSKVEAFGLRWTTDNNQAIRESQIIFLAVKPGKVAEVLKKVNFTKESKLIISLAAGVSLEKLKHLVKGKNFEIVRIMPSLAVQSGEGIIGLYAGKLKSQKLDFLKKKLSPVCKLIKVEKEDDLDLLTIILGCAPALIAYFAQSFTNLSSKSEKVVLKSLIGSLKYIEESGLTFREVIAAVATPGGITENILNHLDKKQVKENIQLALASGYKKLERIQDD